MFTTWTSNMAVRCRSPQGHDKFNSRFSRRCQLIQICDTWYPHFLIFNRLISKSAPNKRLETLKLISMFQSTMANSTSSSSRSVPWTSFFEDSEEIKQNGKKLKISDRKPVFFVPNIYRDQMYTNIREYTLKKPRGSNRRRRRKRRNPICTRQRRASMRKSLMYF